MKNLLLSLPLMAVLFVFGCGTESPYGEPIKTIDRPVQPAKYDEISDQYFRNGELWRGDSLAVSQVETYKQEGKAAVLLDQKVIRREDENTKQVVEVTTVKNIYHFHLEKPHFAAPVWWIRQIEVYDLPSQDRAENPALTNSISPVLRDPTGIMPAKSRVEEPEEEPAP